MRRDANRKVTRMRTAMKTSRLLILTTVLLSLACLTLGPAAAQSDGQSVEQFYKNRVVTLMVATSPGGRYDFNARMIAKHLGPFIPGNPKVVVQNLPSGGGLTLANRFYNIAERDGSIIGVMQPGTPQVAIQGDEHARFDPLGFTWLGSLSSFADDADLLILSPKFGAKNAADLRKPDVKATLGSGTPGSTNLTFALIARDVLGLNLNIVRGYPGAPRLHLAMESGEVDGQVVLMSSIKATKPQIWAERKFVPIVAFGRVTRSPELPDVPTARELAAGDPKGLAILDFAELPFFMSLPLLAPPNIPADRAAALKAAFMAMTKDEAFRQDAIKAEIDLSPIDGDAVVALLRKAVATPKDVIARYNEIVPLGK
jgi:tripartite-type tricarboxylate transporter receptor subunit TctC